MALHHQRAGGQQVRHIREDFRHQVIAEVVAEVGIHGCIRRAEVVGEQPRFFLKTGNQRATEIEKWIIGLVTDDRVTPRGQLKIYEFAQAVFFGRRGDGGSGRGESDLVFEVGHGGWAVAGWLARTISRPHARPEAGLVGRDGTFPPLSEPV